MPSQGDLTGGQARCEVMGSFFLNSGWNTTRSCSLRTLVPSQVNTPQRTWLLAIPSGRASISREIVSLLRSFGAHFPYWLRKSVSAKETECYNMYPL